MSRAVYQIMPLESHASLNSMENLVFVCPLIATLVIYSHLQTFDALKKVTQNYDTTWYALAKL